MLRATMLLALGAAATAEFDSCARPTGIWAGFDQGYGRSRGLAATYTSGNLYVGGYAIGNLSFHSMHRNGDYTDHEGTSTTHDTYTDVTNHHDAETFTDPDYYKHPAMTQHGMDSIIYKISEAGVPLAVFAADTTTFDGIYGADSVNGLWSSYSQIVGLDGFDGEADMVVATGYFRGNVTFPMAGGATKMVANDKEFSNYYGFVVKVNMATGEAVWATDVGLREILYTRATASTAAGHVLVSGNYKSPSLGFLGMYDGATGANLWTATYSGTSVLSSVTAVGEVAYTSGLFSGYQVDPFATGTALTSSSNGTGSDAFVAALDVSSGTGASPSWVVQIGQSGGYPAVVASGAFLFVAGDLKAPATIGACSMTGAFGGYLAKLNRADGSCVWAKDTPPVLRVVTDGAHAWTVESSKSALQFDANHTIDSIGNEDDIFVAKYQASDGLGLWATVIGGTGDDTPDDATITPSGPVFVGSARSESLSLGELTVNNLHHQTAEAVSGFDPDTSHAQNAAQRTLFALMVDATDATPSCLTCPSGSLTAGDTTVDGGYCYVHGECTADGAFSQAHYPAFSCMQCDAAASQTALQPADTTSHCYFNGICHPSGERAPASNWRNEASVCEQCDPTVDSSMYTLTPGYTFDFDFKGNHNNEANEYGMLFDDWSNGCQLLPEVPMDGASSAELTAAMANPTSADVADVGARTTSAIAATRGATDANHGAKVASAWYHGNPDTCTMVGDVCQWTPAETADELGAALETDLYYGHAVARVKVMQGLALLDHAMDTGDPAISAEDVTDLKTDIVAHMLITDYQGVLQSAYELDVTADDATAKANGLAYWGVIDGAIGDDWDASDRVALPALFTASPSGTDNYCVALAILLRNLPDASNLQYSGSHAAGMVTITDASGVVHLTATDLGTHSAAPACPSPPPPPSTPGAPNNPLVHSHDRELCGCAQHEADHPFVIDCDDAATIRQAYADLKACEVDGEATEAACESVNTEGVMECQQAFFILQAHHDYCSHDTLTYAEEEYVHVWEASCLKCAIERKYDSNLLDCPVVNCADTSVIDAAYWIVNTTCLAADNTLEYEWGGSFDTPASSYVWVSQPVGESSPYEWADPSMTMAFLPMASSDYAALDDLAGPVGTADLLLQQTCIPKVSGDTVVPSATDCYLFDFTGLGDADFTVTIDTSGTAHLGIFAQHVPVEFERTIHYLQAQYPPLSDADSVEPIAEVGAPGTHEHRRLQESRGRDNRRKLGALGSCCNNAHQIGAFRSIVAYHDLCDHDDLPYYVEVGLHDYEQSCEDYFCNAVASDYDGTICPSPPPPPAPPMEPSATSCGAVINGTVTNGDFDGDGAFRLADASFTADVWSDIKSWPWNAGRRLDDGEGARRLEVANRVLKKPRRRLRRLLASQKGEKRAGTTFSSLVGKKEGQTMQVHAFLGTDPAHVVGSTAGLRWKTVEVAFSGGQIKSAVAHHDGLRALIQGTTVAGVVDLSGSGKTFPPGLAMTVTFSAETNMDDVRIDFSSPITIVTTGVRPHPTMVAPQSQPPSAARA